MEKGRFSRLPVWRKLLTAVLSVMWIALVGLVGSICVDESKTRDEGAETTATVLHVDYDSKGGLSSADIRFETKDGRLVETSVDLETAKDFDETENAVKVRYRPSDPANTVVVAEIDRFSYWFLLGIIGVVLLIFPGAVLRKLAGYGKDDR